MILAEHIKSLMSLTKQDLVKILSASGYTGCSFESSQFLGLTNGAQFCYSITYWDDGANDETLDTGKVFVSLDTDTGVLTADF